MYLKDQPKRIGILAFPCTLISQDKKTFTLFFSRNVYTIVTGDKKGILKPVKYIRETTEHFDLCNELVKKGEINNYVYMGEAVDIPEDYKRLRDEKIKADLELKKSIRKLNKKLKPKTNVKQKRNGKGRKKHTRPRNTKTKSISRRITKSKNKRIHNRKKR